MTGFIEIEVFKRVKYFEIEKYVYELMIYMQLFYPGKFQIDKLLVLIGDSTYEMNIYLNKPKYTDRYIQSSTKLDILDFLKRCYLRIPYRNSKDQFRNIPYIVMKSYVNVEDNFLMLYRFIECFYKRQLIKEFISTAIKNHYHPATTLLDDQIQNYTQEIITLRNKYVHSGYYIKSNKLNIRFDRSKDDPRNYTVAVNSDWIINRVVILRKIVIDIIFTEMLGINEYEYK